MRPKIHARLISAYIWRKSSWRRVVVVELGVEGDTELFVLTGGDDTAIDFGQGLGVAVHLDDAGRTDKC